MEQIVKVAALCLIGAILGAVLKKTGPEQAAMISLALTIVVGSMLLQLLDDILSFVQKLMELGGLLPQLFRPLFKTVAIALVSRVGCELCRDADSAAAASLVEICGAFGAVLAALPLFETVWDMLQGML